MTVITQNTRYVVVIEILDMNYYCACINNGEFLKNDLLPKLVLGSEDRKSVLKVSLLFQIIPEVKLY